MLKLNSKEERTTNNFRFGKCFHNILTNISKPKNKKCKKKQHINSKKLCKLKYQKLENLFQLVNIFGIPIVKMFLST